MARRIEYEVGSYINGIQYLGDVPKELWKTNKRVIYLKCHCGKKYIARLNDVNTGNTKSCGCAKGGRNKKDHGLVNTRQYKIWTGMKTRCNNANQPCYSEYGGRGITYDASWETFEGFWNDMSNGYNDELEIDRINPNGNYCKNNCRWVTAGVQGYNTRMSRRNSSGKTGVSFDRKGNKWRAYISKDNTQHHLGFFETYEEACEIREKAEIDFYGFNVS